MKIPPPPPPAPPNRRYNSYTGKLVQPESSRTKAAPKAIRNFMLLCFGFAVLFLGIPWLWLFLSKSNVPTDAGVFWLVVSIMLPMSMMMIFSPMIYEHLEDKYYE